MMKNIWTVIFITIFIASCGFTTPKKTSNVNFDVIGDRDFVKIIDNKLDKSLPKRLTLNIISVAKNKISSAFSGNSVYAYDLETIVKYSISQNKNILFQNSLSASRHVKNSNSSANAYQEEKAYKDMQNEIINKIIRKIKRL